MTSKRRPVFDSPEKSVRIDDDSSQSEDGFSKQLQRTPKRKLPSNPRSGFFDGNLSKTKILKKMPSLVFNDSPSKYITIDDSSSSTGFGLDETLKPRTPIRKLSLNSSFMLKRFMAESPKFNVNDIVDDSPSKFEDVDEHSESMELVERLAALRSPARNRFYTYPRKETQEMVQGDSEETNVVPESQSPAKSDISKLECSNVSNSWWKNEGHMEVELQRTPTRGQSHQRIASQTRARPVTPTTVVVGSEEIVDYSPFKSRPEPMSRSQSQSQHITLEPDSGETSMHGMISSQVQVSSSKRFRDLIHTPPRRRILNSDSLDITVDESPSKSEIDLREREKVKDKTPIDKLNLGLALKRKLAQHNFNLRNWTNAVVKKSGNVNDKEAIHLFIVKCFKLGGIREKGSSMKEVTLSLCVHLPKLVGVKNPELTWKWVIFRTQSQNPKPFIPGVSLVKLYPPWQEVSLSSRNEDVAICTDFYQFVDPADIHINFEELKGQTRDAKLEIDQRVAEFFNSGSPHPTFLDLVPYKIRNMKTIKKQILYSRRSIDLDVVICHVWFNEKSIRILVKDSDNILSYVEASPNDDNLVENISAGKFFKLEALTIQRKVTPNLWLPLFSVIATFGGVKQTSTEKFYYELLLTQSSKWEIVPQLEIPFSGCDCPKKNVKDLVEIPENVDCRLTVEGVLEPKSNSKWDFYFHDLDDFSFKIRVKIMPAFGAERISAIDPTETVHLLFMRLFRGTATLDQFSSVKQ